MFKHERLNLLFNSKLLFIVLHRTQKKHATKIESVECDSEIHIPSILSDYIIRITDSCRTDDKKRGKKGDSSAEKHIYKMNVVGNGTLLFIFYIAYFIPAGLNTIIR